MCKPKLKFDIDMELCSIPCTSYQLYLTTCMYALEKLSLHNICIPGFTFISNFVQVVQTTYYKFMLFCPSCSYGELAQHT